MSAGNAVVHELVTDGLPRLSPIILALNLLPKPAAGLRRIQPVRIDGRTLQMVDLPAPKERATDIPLLAFAIRCQDKGALPRTHQNSYSAHLILPFCEFIFHMFWHFLSRAKFL